MAAKARIPALAVGNGYTLPPSDLYEYPRFFSGEGGIRAKPLLTNINQGLAIAKLSAIKALPELFKADFVACCTIPLLDPFSQVRGGGQLGPALATPLRLPSGETPDNGRAFAYISDLRVGNDILVRALCQCAGIISVYGPGLSPTDVKRLEDRDITVFRSPQPLNTCLLYTSPSPRDQRGSRMPSSA